MYDGKFMSRQWIFSHDLSNKFWKRWIKECLPAVHPRKTCHDEFNPIKVNDLVVVVDDLSPRNIWLGGIFIGVCPGKDDHVSVAGVKTKSVFLRRPVTRLRRLHENKKRMSYALCKMEILRNLFEVFSVPW